MDILATQHVVNAAERLPVETAPSSVVVETASPTRLPPAVPWLLAPPATELLRAEPRLRGPAVPPDEDTPPPVRVLPARLAGADRPPAPTALPVATVPVPPVETVGAPPADETILLIGADGETGVLAPAREVGVRDVDPPPVPEAGEAAVAGVEALPPAPAVPDLSLRAVPPVHVRAAGRGDVPTAAHRDVLDVAAVLRGAHAHVPLADPPRYAVAVPPPQLGSMRTARASARLLLLRFVVPERPPVATIVPSHLVSLVAVLIAARPRILRVAGEVRVAAPRLGRGLITADVAAERDDTVTLVAPPVGGASAAAGGVLLLAALAVRGPPIEVPLVPEGVEGATLSAAATAVVADVRAGALGGAAVVAAGACLAVPRRVQEAPRVGGLRTSLLSVVKIIFGMSAPAVGNALADLRLLEEMSWDV